MYIDFTTVSSTVEYHNSLGMMSLNRNVQGTCTVKHIDVQYHYLRDAGQGKTGEWRYTPSNDDEAESLSKLLI